MAGAIFISYRRDDSRHAAGRLYQHLVQTFPRDRLFIDVDAISPGLDFVTEITSKVEICDALLAVIGPDWLKSIDGNGNRRIDDPGDFVRLEIETALRRDIRVIPVLLDDVTMPREQDLPQALKLLARRNAARLSHARFGLDADVLVQTLLDELHLPVSSRARLPLASDAAARLQSRSGGFFALIATGLTAGVVIAFAMGNILGDAMAYAKFPALNADTVSPLDGPAAIILALIASALLFVSIVSFKLKSTTWRPFIVALFFGSSAIYFLGAVGMFIKFAVGFNNVGTLLFVLAIVAVVVPAVQMVQSLSR